MKLLEDRIRKDGIVGEGDILKVSSFLNHRMDIELLCELGKEFRRIFDGEKITKIMTVEASGIGVAAITALYFDKVPVVYAKKNKTGNLSDDVYTVKAMSYTGKKEFDIVVSKEFITPDDKVLIIDDFMAMGSAVTALADLIGQAGAEIVGAGIVVEKAYQPGGELLRSRGVRVESLARVKSMSVENGIEFC